MAETEKKKKDICLRIEKLCQHIKENCKNMKIYGNVVMIQSLVHFQIGRIQEIVDELEEFSASNKFGNQSVILLAQAYAMLGNKEKADGRAEGWKDGRAEGWKDGKTKGKAEDVIELLEDLGDLSDSLKACIMEQTDLELLKKWHKAAAKAKSIEEFEEAIELVQI